MNEAKRRIYAVAMVVSALSFGITSAFASESPFQDYMSYQKIVDGNGDPAELSRFVLPNFRAAFDAKSAEEKAQYCKVIRNLFQIQDIKLRSESQAGNEATVVFDCRGMATAEIGSTMLMQPLVGVATMTKSNGSWITQRLDMKRPKEFAALGTATAGSINNEKRWCAEGHKVAVPNKPLSGMLQGSHFTLESATFGAFTGALGLRIADSPKFKNLNVYIFLDSKFDPKSSGTYSESNGVKNVSFSGKIDGRDSTLNFDRGNGLMISLQRMPLKDGNYPCYLLLRLPDGKRTELKGYLYAKALP